MRLPEPQLTIFPTQSHVPHNCLVNNLTPRQRVSFFLRFSVVLRPPFFIISTPTLIGVLPLLPPPSLKAVFCYFYDLSYQFFKRYRDALYFFFPATIEFFSFWECRVVFLILTKTAARFCCGSTLISSSPRFRGVRWACGTQLRQALRTFGVFSNNHDVSYSLWK